MDTCTFCVLGSMIFRCVLALFVTNPKISLCIVIITDTEVFEIMFHHITSTWFVAIQVNGFLLLELHASEVSYIVTFRTAAFRSLAQEHHFSVGAVYVR